MEPTAKLTCLHEHEADVRSEGRKSLPGRGGATSPSCESREAGLLI